MPEFKWCIVHLSRILPSINSTSCIFPNFWHMMRQATIGTTMELGYLIDLESEKMGMKWLKHQFCMDIIWGFIKFYESINHQPNDIHSIAPFVQTYGYTHWTRNPPPAIMTVSHSVPAAGNAFQKYATPLSKPLTTAVATPGLLRMKPLAYLGRGEKQTLRSAVDVAGFFWGPGCSAKEACPGLKAEAFWSLMKFDKKNVGQKSAAWTTYIRCKCDMPQWPTGFAYSRSVTKRDGDPGLRSSGPPDSRKVLQDCAAYVLHSGFYWSLVV